MGTPAARTTGDWIACPCGKRGYQGPRAARKANQSNQHRLRAYRCEHGAWHVTKSDNQFRLKGNPA